MPAHSSHGSFQERHNPFCEWCDFQEPTIGSWETIYKIICNIDLTTKQSFKGRKYNPPDDAGDAHSLRLLTEIQVICRPDPTLSPHRHMHKTTAVQPQALLNLRFSQLLRFSPEAFGIGMSVAGGGPSLIGTLGDALWGGGAGAKPFLMCEGDPLIGLGA